MKIKQNKIKRKVNEKNQEKILNLFMSVHPILPSKLRRLNDKEKNVIEKFVKNKKYEYRKKAIHALVISEHKNHVKILEKIIKNKKEDKIPKALAIISLGNSKDLAAEKLLMECISTRDEFLKTKVIKSLAKIGNKKCIDMLNKYAKSKKPQIVNNAKLTRKLINYRLQTEGKY